MRRVSRQRSCLLHILKSRKDHPSAEQLYADAKKQMPRISLGTVYRNVNLLRNAGLIRMISAPGEPARYDAVTTDHCHVRCRTCGRIHDLPAEMFSLDKVVCIPGFTVTRWELNLEGICSECDDSVRGGDRFAGEDVSG